LLEHLCRYPDRRSDKGLVSTIQHRRETLLDSSRAITERIERICRASG
jgi:hypothetical protein